MENKAKLLNAKRKIILQNKKLEKYSQALLSANEKIMLHYKEKVSHESELAKANILLTFENNEKEKRAAELVIANKKLIFENNEKEKRAAELVVANKKLLFENNEKGKRAEELVIINRELTKAETLQKEHIDTLEEMMFIISHKVRCPVANILGISYLLEENETKSTEEFKSLIQMLSQSALSLNALTEELATYIHTKRVKSAPEPFSET